MYKLTAEQNREYHTVVLAASLHDIGKLLHRGTGSYGGSHEKASCQFIERFSDRLRNDELYDIDLVALIVEHHHSTKTETLSHPYFVNKTKEHKDRIWKLITIVKRADSYSCAEREILQQRRKEIELAKAPLDSIFTHINLNSALRDENGVGRHHLSRLSPFGCFPDKTLEALSGKEISALIEEFENNIPSFSQLGSFDDILNKWLDVLAQYTWAVPSDTRYEISDVSLYDHLRSSAAIAACLYYRHVVAIEAGKRLDRLYEFVLVGGDFTGIQDYIFDITNKGSGGASKRLRARSLFVYLFSEVTVHKILHALRLPITCNLFSAAGKFLLLAPNVDEIKVDLQRVKAEIEQEIHETFFNQFSFLMSWNDIRGFRDKFRVYSFFKTADDMFHQLEVEKFRTCRSVLMNGKSGLWNEAAFKASELYGRYEGSGDCKICGKGPAVCEDRDPESGESVMVCPLCYRDKYVIGHNLPKSRYIAFGKSLSSENTNKKRIVLFNPRPDIPVTEDSPVYYVDLLEAWEDNSEHYLVCDIGTNQEDSDSRRPPKVVTRYVANHVPIGDGNVLTFEDIASLSAWQKGGKVFGSRLLGILKADIDNLGLIFSKGFENPSRAEAGLDDIDRKTVSRFLTLSRMTELFFSGWTKEIMSRPDKSTIIDELTETANIDQIRFQEYLKSDHIDFRSIYTVYSGGDDLVLVGPWETMIVFAIYLHAQFRKYTCNNRFVTLSAGLTFAKPKYPIASGIAQADELLRRSKEAGKDRITFFDTTIEWKKLPELIDFFLFLDQKLNDEDSRLNPAFLHRLLEYHRLAVEYVQHNTVHGLRYLSLLSYDIGRNVIKRANRDIESRVISGQQEYSVLHQLINRKPNRDSLMYNVKIPLFWALYRNRTG